MSPLLDWREGESRRDAEIRWQEANDFLIRDAIAKGESRRSVAERFGISTTAVLNAMRRQATRDGKPEPKAPVRKETARATYRRLRDKDADLIIQLTEAAIRRGVTHDVYDLLARAQNIAYRIIRRKAPSSSDRRQQ